MAKKYLHKFETDREFKKEYNGPAGGSVVTGFTCSNAGVEGTFEATLHYYATGAWSIIYIWKNQQGLELATERRDVSVGDWAYNLSTLEGAEITEVNGPDSFTCSFGVFTYFEKSLHEFDAPPGETDNMYTWVDDDEDTTVLCVTEGTDIVVGMEVNDIMTAEVYIDYWPVLVTEVHEDETEAVYYEPWVSYTLESGFTKTVATGFTASLNDRAVSEEDISGVFTYYGHAYAYDRTGYGDEIRFSQTVGFEHIWTNGKIYVTLQAYGYPDESGLVPVQGMRLSRTFDAENPSQPWAPGKKLYMASETLGSAQVNEVMTATEDISQVAYNRPAVHLFWDGTYITMPNSQGVMVPNYVVDNERSCKNIFTQAFDVYVNDVRDESWRGPRKLITSTSSCWYYTVIYRDDIDGKLYCKPYVTCILT